MRKTRQAGSHGPPSAPASTSSASGSRAAAARTVRRKAVAAAGSHLAALGTIGRSSGDSASRFHCSLVVVCRVIWLIRTGSGSGCNRTWLLYDSKRKFLLMGRCGDSVEQATLVYAKHAGSANLVNDSNNGKLSITPCNCLALHVVGWRVVPFL